MNSASLLALLHNAAGVKMTNDVYYQAELRAYNPLDSALTAINERRLESLPDQRSPPPA